MLKQILSVGGWTLVSRITGFVRDVVIAAVMGIGPVADAFVVALRLPNHFRAIFGEGAFNSAFVPAYAAARETNGSAAAKLLADRIFTLMLIVQLALLAAALIGMPFVVRALAPGFSEDPQKFALAVTLTRITFPYLLFVTLVTLLSGLLNAHERFAAAAAAPILLNLSLIAALSVAFLFPTAGHAAAWGVAAAGVLEFLLVWADARRNALGPVFARPRLDEAMRRFFKTLGPAVVGSAGVQLAMFADTIIASLLPTGAVSSLYYADRLYQLPVGVIGIAAGTVLLPQMSRRLAAGDVAGAHGAQNRALGFSSADRPVVVRGNGYAISDAVRNLVENAVVHTPPGSEVTVAVHRDGRISVTDRGPGVAEPDRERIFERFWRGSRAHSNGAGLGLPIAAEIMKAHGGAVTVGDAPEGGAIFTLVFAPAMAVAPAGGRG